MAVLIETRYSLDFKSQNFPTSQDQVVHFGHFLMVTLSFYFVSLEMRTHCGPEFYNPMITRSFLSKLDGSSFLFEF